MIERDDEVASAETMAAPAENRPTLDVGSAGGALAARARLPVVERELYELLGEFARGGLGRILRARDIRSGRLVAIKEMLKGAPDAAARFEREALVTANLQHPAIVPVYEVGRWPDGEPFFAMKLVTGRSLAEAIAATKDRDDRLRLLPHVIAVADALAYAHAQGWIHRDLKPHNVLVGDHGETVVIDWGLARRAGDVEVAAAADAADDAPDATMVGAVLGTPAYMAPEQAAGLVVDARADVYAIGAMMRHLLTGSPAFADSRDVRELLQRVRTVAPPALAVVAPRLPTDLIAIVERAMARDRDERYATAGELAEDLRRFTTGRLVAAHRYTRRERLRRFAQRNRGALLVAAVALVTSIGYGAWSVRRIVDERDQSRAATARAEAASAEADQQRATATSRLAILFGDRGRLELLAGRPQRALPYLAEAMRLGADSPGVRFVVARALEQVDHVVARWVVDDLVKAAFAPGSDDVVIVGRSEVSRRGLDGTQRWRAPIGNSAEMIVVGDDRVAVSVPGGVLVLDAKSGATLADLRISASTEVPAGLSANPDGSVLVAGYESGTIRAWDLATTRVTATIDTGAPANFPRLLADGQRVIVGGWSKQGDVPTTVWDVRTGRRLAELCPAAARCPTVVIAADGRVVLGRVGGGAGGVDHVELLDAGLARVGGFDLPFPATDLALVGDRVLVLGTRALEARALDGTVRWSTAIGNGGWSLATSRDGTRAVAATVSGEHAIVDVATGIVVARQSGAHRTDQVAFSADQQRVLGFGLDHIVTVWDASHPMVTPIATSAERTWRVDAVDDTTVVLGTADGEVSIRDAASGAERLRIHAHQGLVLTAQVFDDLGLITSSADGTACRWDIMSGAKLRCWDHGAKVRRAEPSPDRTRLVTAGADNLVRLWDLDTGALIRSWSLPRSVMMARWSPDGSAIAAIDEAGDVVVRDNATNAILRDDPGPGGNLFAGVTVEFSPDGALIATGRRAVRQYLLGARDKARDLRLDGGDGLGLMFGVAFDPSGRRLAGTGTDEHVHIWEVATGNSLQTLDAEAEMHAAAWSADGTLLATGGVDRVVHVWDPEAGVELAALDAGADVYTLELAPGGGYLAIGTDAPTAVLWHLSSFTGTSDALAEVVRCRGLWRLDGERLVPADPGACP